MSPDIVPPAHARGKPATAHPARDGSRTIRAMSFTVLDHPLAGRPAHQPAGEGDRAGRIPVAHAAPGPAPGDRGHPEPAHRAASCGDPLERFEGARLAAGLVAIPVLRAGSGLLDAVVDLYPDAVVGLPGDGARRGHARAARLLREAAADARPPRAGGGPDAGHRWLG